MIRNFVLALGLISIAVSSAAATHSKPTGKLSATTHSKPTGKLSANKQGKPASKLSTSDHGLSASKLSAAEIVDKNVSARGGLHAWREVSSLTMSGKMEAGGTKNPELAFVMKMKRDHKSRLEIRFEDQTAVQVYDGSQGWKLRPFLGRDDAEPFTPFEAKLATTWAELDGPLIDYAKKGTKLMVEGVEAVEGHKAYRLKLTMTNGAERRVWIDTKSFLEAKIDGDPRKLDGKLRNVAVFYRDYKAEHGLNMPHTLETVVEGDKQSHKMHIDQVAVNQPMEDALFTKTMMTMASAPKQ